MKLQLEEYLTPENGYSQKFIYSSVNYTQHTPYNCRAGRLACVGSQHIQLSLVLQILNPQNSLTLQPQEAQTSVLLQVHNMRKPYTQDSNHIGRMYFDICTMHLKLWATSVVKVEDIIKVEIVVQLVLLAWLPQKLLGHPSAQRMEQVYLLIYTTAKILLINIKL